MGQVHYHLFVVVVVNSWLNLSDTSSSSFARFEDFQRGFLHFFQITFLEHLPTQPFLVSKRRRQLVLKLVFPISVSKQFWDKTSTTTIYLASQPLWNNVHPHPVSDQPNWYLFVILCIQSDVTHSTASSISTILKIIPFW